MPQLAKLHHLKQLLQSCSQFFLTYYRRGTTIQVPELVVYGESIYYRGTSARPASTFLFLIQSQTNTANIVIISIFGNFACLSCAVDAQFHSSLQLNAWLLQVCLCSLSLCLAATF